MHRRVLLIILDGWGLAASGPGNAVSIANTPNFDQLWSGFPHLKLSAAGLAVGLPEGQMGNSEVGHLNIGAGRIVLQDLPRISKSIEDGEFFHNKALLSAMEHAKKDGKSLHLIGLVSPGGVHSHEKHLYALLEMAKQNSAHDVYVHVITDGRDVDPKSALADIIRLEKKMKNIGVGKIATICGRYYAMDRDKRWERTKAAYDAIVEGMGEFSDSAEQAVRDSYALGINDEFIRPVIIDKQGMLKNDDTLIFFNFRSDRPRQISSALADKYFDGLKRKTVLSKLYFVTFTEYSRDLPVSAVAFPTDKLKNTLADVIASHGMNQFHIAETEKYAHVTYFFEGGIEKRVKGESRLMVPSPKVDTYDEQPEMSAMGVKDELLAQIGNYDFIIANFANPDMVGHTGMIDATIKALETVDAALGEVVEKAYADDYDIIVIADHGNAEKMIEADGSPCTSHTTNKVPFMLVSQEEHILSTVSEPKLSNIAPTVLSLLGLEVPQGMNQKPLVRKVR